MHELDITRTLIREAEGEAEKEEGSPSLIRVRIGVLTTFKKDPILFYFDAIKGDSEVLANTELEVEEVLGRAKCKSCKKEFEVREYWDIRCPSCCGSEADILSGEDIEIMEIIYE